MKYVKQGLQAHSLSTATIEYSCVWGGVSVCLAVCLSVYTVTLELMVQST